MSTCSQISLKQKKCVCIIIKYMVDNNVRNQYLSVLKKLNLVLYHRLFTSTPWIEKHVKGNSLFQRFTAFVTGFLCNWCSHFPFTDDSRRGCFNAQCHFVVYYRFCFHTPSLCIKYWRCRRQFDIGTFTGLRSRSCKLIETNKCLKHITGYLYCIVSFLITSDDHFLVKFNSNYS